MRCEECDYPNDDDFRFCGRCGHQLSLPDISFEARTTKLSLLIECPACGKQVSPQAPACLNCGQPIKSSVEVGTAGAINPQDPIHAIAIVLVAIIAMGVFSSLLSHC